jgi:DNA (cytosine-5)-methyltransferase 1
VKPRLLDLFCGAGGAAMGYHRAGFEVVGVDIAPQPNYPFEFHEGDALVALGGPNRSPYRPRVGLRIRDFDAIHASPPCQAYSDLHTLNGRREYPDLIEPVRAALRATGIPYVIENVEGAPLEHPIRICGSGIGLPLLRRHRLFECSFPAMGVPCAHGVTEKRFPALNGQDRKRGGRSGIVGVYGNGGDKRADLWADAMGIDWMTRQELTQAIPPRYTEHVGSFLLAEVRRRSLERAA